MVSSGTAEDRGTAANPIGSNHIGGPWMSYIFTMDGITVQHAGELLFDTAATVTKRAACAGTYLRSLEDVAFALIFGSGLTVTKNLPKVGNETPGTDLCQHFASYVSALEVAGVAPPDELVEKPAGRRRVRVWLSGLNRLRRKDYPFWRELILREAEAHLWPSNDADKALLLRSIPDRSKLAFGKNYWMVSELQDALPQGFIMEMAKSILACYSLPQQSALEFVERVVVTHAVIFEWYLRRLRHGAGPEIPLTYLPHVTRTMFFVEDDIDTELWHLQRLVMPRILSEILKGCDRRSEVLRRIEDLVEAGRLEPLRRRLQDALVSLDRDELKKIRRDIECQIDSGAEKCSVDFAIKAGIVGVVPKAEIEIRRRVTKDESSYDAAIRLVLRRSTDIRTELWGQACRVFHELRCGVADQYN